MTNITVTAFKWIPPFAQGLIRDLRVRWALEEAGLPHEMLLVDLEARGGPENRARHPFGMVPAFRADGAPPFETGAILHWIGTRSEKLMPADDEGRAQTLTWMFAALNTVEPPVEHLFDIDQLYTDEPWAKLRRPSAEEDARARLDALAKWLDGRDYLVGRFTVADILMVTVLRFLRHTDLIDQYPAVAAYVARCQDRPAFKRALEAQMSDFERHAPIAA